MKYILYYDEKSMDYNINCKQRGKSDSVANFPALSNPTDAQNVSCLGLCGSDICPKSFA